MVPLGISAGKQIAEPADVSVGLPKASQMISVSASVRRLLRFPRLCRGFRRFRRRSGQAFAFVVEAGERRWVLLGPRNHIDAPSALAVWVFGEEASGGWGIVFAGEEAKVEPLAEFGPGFGFELGFGVGGDHPRVSGNVQRPRGLAGRRLRTWRYHGQRRWLLGWRCLCRQGHRGFDSYDRRPIVLGRRNQNCAGSFHGKGTHHKGEGIAFDGCQPREEFVVVHFILRC